MCDRLAESYREIRLELECVKQAFVFGVDWRCAEVQLALIDWIGQDILGRPRMVKVNAQKIDLVQFGTLLQLLAEGLDIVRVWKALVRVLQLLYHEPTVEKDGVSRRKGHCEEWTGTRS